MVMPVVVFIVEPTESTASLNVFAVSLKSITNASEVAIAANEIKLARVVFSFIWVILGLVLVNGECVVRVQVGVISLPLNLIMKNVFLQVVDRIKHQHFHYFSINLLLS